MAMCVVSIIVRLPLIGLSRIGFEVVILRWRGLGVFGRVWGRVVGGLLGR